MSDFWQIASSWPVRAAVVGGGVLLAGRVLMWITRQPARRSAIGMAAVAVALFAIPLTALPGWLPVTVPETKQDAAVVEQLPQRADRAPVLILPHPRVKTESATAPLVAAPPPTTSTPVAPLAAEPAPSQPVLASAPSSSSVTVRLLLLIAYAFIAVGLLARLVIGHFGLMRIWRRASPPPEWANQVFCELARDLSPHSQLRVSDRPAGPVCFGLVRPRVLVPQSLIETRDHAALRCVFAHELGHLRRRDPLAGWLLGLARAAYFVWPWLASLRREVRLAQEYLADREAMRHASAPADYAELLIRMTRARPAPLGSAAARGPSSELYRRVTMLLRNKETVEARCPRRWKLAIAGGLTALAVGAAGIYIQPRPALAAEPEKKEAPKPAPKGDGIKELIEKLKKDVGDDPDKKKQLEDLQKQLTPKRAEPENPSHAPVPFPPPGIAIPQIFDPDLPEDALLQELLKGQDDMLKQLQQLLGNVQGGQGFAFQMGPDGVFRQLGAGTTRGGRLGVRVEKPSDVLASQLDLPNGQGLVCVDVPANSTAGKIGIKPHDILLEVAGKAVPNDVQRFVTALKDIKPETAIDIVVLRKGKKETLKGVKLPEAKEVAEAPNPFGGFPNLEAIPVPLELPPAAPRVPGVSRVPPAPGVPVPPGRGIGAVAGPGETVRVEQVNDAFTVFYSKNGVKVTITGSKEGDNPAKAESIEVDDNGKTTKAESIDKLPKEYQDLAKSAMKAIK